jgi:hypothetical protein
MSYGCLIFPLFFIAFIGLIFYLKRRDEKILIQLFEFFCVNTDYEVINKKVSPEIIGTYKSIPFKISYYSGEESSYMKFRADLFIPCDYNLIIDVNERQVKVGAVKPIKLLGVDLHKAFRLPDMIATGDEEFDQLFLVAARNSERLKPIVNELINQDIKAMLKKFYDKYKYIPKIELKDHYLELQNYKEPKDNKSWNDILHIMEKFVVTLMKDEMPSLKEKLLPEDKNREL